MHACMGQFLFDASPCIIAHACILVFDDQFVFACVTMYENHVIIYFKLAILLSATKLPSPAFLQPSFPPAAFLDLFWQHGTKLKRYMDKDGGK